MNDREFRRRRREAMMDHQDVANEIGRLAMALDCDPEDILEQLVETVIAEEDAGKIQDIIIGVPPVEEGEKT